MRYFSLWLSEEVREKIDVMAVTPSIVSTAMAGHQKPTAKIATTTEMVKDALVVLGHKRETPGSRKHQAMIAVTMKMTQDQVLTTNGKIMRKMMKLAKNH